MTTNNEEQVKLYVKPEIECIEVLPCSAICASGVASGQDPDEPMNL